MDNKNKNQQNAQNKKENEQNKKNQNEDRIFEDKNQDWFFIPFTSLP